VLLDDAQYTRRDWRNRNIIKTPAGLRWLTIPVETKGRFDAPIDAIRIAEPWATKHWAALHHAYARAPYFSHLAPRFEALYRSLDEQTMLSAVNRRAIEEVCAVLGIDTPIRWSREYPVRGMRTDRLLSICIAAGATEYVSGPSARSYMELDKFAASGIAVRFVDYSAYPEYTQLHVPFVHGVSVLDLLFNLGDNALSAMRRLA
jgi:WbqC-like protein family